MITPVSQRGVSRTAVGISKPINEAPEHRGPDRLEALARAVPAQPRQAQRIERGEAHAKDDAEQEWMHAASGRARELARWAVSYAAAAQAGAEIRGSGG